VCRRPRSRSGQRTDAARGTSDQSLTTGTLRSCGAPTTTDRQETPQSRRARHRRPNRRSMRGLGRIGRTDRANGMQSRLRAAPGKRGRAHRRRLGPLRCSKSIECVLRTGSLAASAQLQGDRMRRREFLFLLRQAAGNGAMARPIKVVTSPAKLCSI
jgi:hypothetical protein